MPRASTDELNCFLAVAREMSFTRAAAKIGISPSALSHAMRSLEERLSVRLLNRTTRSVSLTEAGQRLLDEIGPHLDAVALSLDGLSDLKGKPAGTVRITAGEHPAQKVLAPALADILPQYPGIKVEITVDSALTDIVSERFDAGIRMGAQIARDMIAVPIGPAIKMAVVGSPTYLAKAGTPNIPLDLTSHSCVGMRFPTLGGLAPWEFENADKEEVTVRVDGQLIVNNARLARQFAIDGHGLAYMPSHYTDQAVADGLLVRVLEPWCPPLAGYHLFYPSRRQPTQAFSILLKALQQRRIS
ncbi:LysR substrate-binding domain-containing protein [Pseudomonas capsici]|uniref:LysR family transcriptional regulator n=1 Tax=Pseudomonas capsici TaxID=2810614 RepID=UPI001910BDE3|nr:LysR family transcriptional regulator [Pseudomonas capsici]MBX8610893.1 LysR family transcriptional regulator [Pseudomonas cichorii]MCV4273906.1 LysR substrate-binding domain-containing protein [Pseudomonas capsici]